MFKDKNVQEYIIQNPQRLVWVFDLLEINYGATNLLADKSDIMDQIWTLLKQNNLNSFTLYICIYFKTGFFNRICFQGIITTKSNSRKENKHLPF